ncbi:MAG TPA: hypothetical protein VKT33_08670 [Candidatus Angelobacter sp.]|nr:hypothetical protein [Candidatus Angelobacter sp.]
MASVFGSNNAAVLTLLSLPDDRGGVCTVWYQGKPRKDLVTFAPEAWLLICHAMGGSINLGADVILQNFKCALNQLLRQWNFDQRGVLHFDKAMADQWVNQK